MKRNSGPWLEYAARLIRPNRAQSDVSRLEAVPSTLEILDGFESLGDSCEFGTLQKHAGIETMSMFKWSATPLLRLAGVIADDLAGVDDPKNVHMRIEQRSIGSDEYMIDHARLDSPMHSFLNVDEMSMDEAFQRQMRRLTLLRRKFLEDVRTGRRIYVYRSFDPRPMDEVRRVHEALRSKGPNRLLFVRHPGDGLEAGDVVIDRPGLAVAAIDQLAPYHAATVILTQMWPSLLERARVVLGAA
jgi:hypothetical protein